MNSVADFLDKLTVEGELYEKLDDNAVRCYACAHRCLIRNGRRGICQVRFNKDGKLMVPWGYVAGMQADPIEKKPFFHLLPGEDALTFGMLGCDFHCDYCFTGDTMVLTDQGPKTLADIFSHAQNRIQQPDGEITFPDNLRTVTSSGSMRYIRAAYRHPYHGELVSIRPYYLPEFQCTPDHRVYATINPESQPELIEAGTLTQKHYLAVPHMHYFSQSQVIQTDEILKDFHITYRIRWNLTHDQRKTISELTAQGVTSRQIGEIFGKCPSYIRHVRSKLARGRGSDERTSGPIVKDGMLRYPNEHRPGIPVTVSLDERMAALIGYYCAEGSAVKSKERPNSWVLNFSLSHQEVETARKIQHLLMQCLKLESHLVMRPTTMGISVNKASAAILFSTLAGNKAIGKRVPVYFYNAPAPVVRAFLDALVIGDGHRYENGKISLTTVSRELAYGVAWLVLNLGHLPSLYDSHMTENGTVQGRQVKRAPHQYTLVWYEQDTIQRKFITKNDYYLVPLRNIEQSDFVGEVYNIEVDEEHSYLANFFQVSNCQNWLSSQVLRDPAAKESAEYIHRISPEQMVLAAQRTGAKVIASSYNEPLITSEWAVAIFRLAQQAGLKCAFVSNGNATPQVLEYLRPYLSAYKIDLKTMQDKHYRQLGGVLQNVLDSIRRAQDLGLWVEVVTLVVPGFNDSNKELMEIARFIASVSPDIPWHVTGFHPDYKMTDPLPTSVNTLIRAAEIGEESGLKHVYAGNIPGRTKNYENTYCPHCKAPLIQRTGYTLRSYSLTAQGTCPKCGTPVAGVWTDKPEEVQLGGWGMPRRI